MDARAGVAGDMLLGALLDAGASLDAVVAAVEAVLPGAVRLTVAEVRRAGMRAAKLDVGVVARDQPHRDWTTIRAMLTDAGLPERVRADALAVFGALAAAEARAHGIDVESVHFHEVGAWDSIADIVGVCAALADLGVSDLAVGTIGLGSGTVRAAHGEVPVPVPAVLELAAGWPVHAGGEGELATPTGMALLTALGRPSAAMPAGTVHRIGIGAGSRDVPGRPNVVRVVLGDFAPTNADAVGAAPAVVLETNVDDLDPRLWPGVLDSLLDAGASDAWLTPILMKKGRPAHMLHVLCDPDAAAALRGRIFELVPTLGLRETPTTKHVLDRAWVSVSVGNVEVRIKLGLRAGRIVTLQPEFNDVAELARALGSPERAVLADAGAAASASGLVVGAGWPPSEPAQ